MVSDPQDLTGVARELGPAAAECLMRCVSGREIVGVTWGTTILALVDTLPFRPWPDVTIVQMLGIGTIRAALRDQILDVLVTDHATAWVLLAETG